MAKADAAEEMNAIAWQFLCSHRARRDGVLEPPHR